jgi:hypothetical protein
MRRRRVFLPSLLALLTVGVLVVGQRAVSPRAQNLESSSPTCCGLREPVAPRQLEFPYYTLRDGFNSSLLLVSDSPKPLEFVVALHSRSGQTVLAPTMTIQPQEKLTVDLRALLASLSADVMGDFAEGSVAIYFNGTIMPLAGQLTMSNPARSLILESEMVDNSPGLGLLPPVLNAVWWGLGGGREARIMVTSTSGDATTADVFLDFQGGRHESPPLVFAPHEVKVLSINELLGDLKVSPAQAPEGGITIVPRSLTPSLVAQGKITDSSTGFSSTLNFMDPSLQQASALHASGLPIGMPSKDSPYAGTGVFIPHVIVRNLTAAPQSLRITVEYPGERDPQQTVLASVPLGPYSTNDISLDSGLGMLPLPLAYCSIRIEYSGAPGSAIAEVSSIEEKGDLVIDSRLANEGDGWAGSGGHPWHLDNETESVLFLTNMSDQTARIGFQVQGGGVHYYLTDLSLKPHETKPIDLRKLRDAQKPDFRGSLIPANATDGSVLWVRLDGVPVMGRLVVLQRHKGVASSYRCSMCNCGLNLTGAPLVMTPTSATITVGGTQQFGALATYLDCNNAPYYIDVTSASSWESKETSIVTVAGGNATGRGGGSAVITARVSGCIWAYPFYTCVCAPHSATGSATVNVKPSITSISPTRGLIGVTTSVTISGKGFGSNPTVQAGTGVTVTRNSFSDTQIQASFAVANNAPSGNHAVTVSTAQGTSNSVIFYVQVPTQLSLVTTISQGPASCSPGAAGWDRWVRWQVLDQNSQPIQRVMSVSDSIAIGSPNTCGASPQTGSTSTDSSGQFPDHYYLCSTACVGGSCQTNATQTWTVSGYVLTADVKSITCTCNGIAINGQ